jgi:hypothetical protein
MPRGTNKSLFPQTISEPRLRSFSSRGGDTPVEASQKRAPDAAQGAGLFAVWRRMGGSFLRCLGRPERTRKHGCGIQYIQDTAHRILCRVTGALRTPSSVACENACMFVELVQVYAFSITCMDSPKTLRARNLARGSRYSNLGF